MEVAEPPPRLSGTCRLVCCLDVARSIDLRAAEDVLKSSRRTTFGHKTRLPREEGALVRPLRLEWAAPALEVGARSTAAAVELALYDFGAIGLTWSLALDDTLEELVEVATQLYDRGDMVACARSLADELVAALGAAADRPATAAQVEDYVVFELRPVEGGPERLLSRERERLARVLRAEPEQLSAQEVDEATTGPISYAADELCLVDWIAALLVGREMEDERLVLEVANVELLEARVLDAQLDRQVELAYALLARPPRFFASFTDQRRELQLVGRMQADGALLHERVENALELFGDDYLARLYRAAGRRFHFAAWHASIERKLGVLRTVHQGLADRAAHRRAEVLELVIILLIAAEIVIFLA